jgi:hypothetical protein
MYDDSDDDDLLEPPYYDMLTIKFRGDDFEITLPYCEVANGDITKLENNNVEIAVVKNDKLERVLMPYTDFTKVVETTFEIKEITRMMVQLAGTYDNVLVYES